MVSNITFLIIRAKNSSSSKFGLASKSNLNSVYICFKETYHGEGKF